MAVKDTGTGLDPAGAERMFQPFFTTKVDGLGMAFPSADQLSKPTAAACGYRRARRMAPMSASLFRYGRSTSPTAIRLRRLAAAKALSALIHVLSLILL
jgi:hypothetical protein